MQAKLIAGSLLTVALYEEGPDYHDSLVNHIFNYKRQVKRNQGSISHKLYHALINLADFTEKISSRNKSIIKNIDLSEYSYLMYRTWAKRKLGMLV